MSTCARRAPQYPAAPTPADQYSPGPIREAHDAEHHAVTRFAAKHPEYRGLPDDVITQAMSTYLTDEEEADRAKLHGEGVPAGWRKDSDNDDEAVEPLGRF